MSEVEEKSEEDLIQEITSEQTTLESLINEYKLSSLLTSTNLTIESLNVNYFKPFKSQVKKLEQNIDEKQIEYEKILNEYKNKCQQGLNEEKKVENIKNDIKLLENKTNNKLPDKLKQLQTAEKQQLMELEKLKQQLQNSSNEIRKKLDFYANTCHKYENYLGLKFYAGKNIIKCVFTNLNDDINNNLTNDFNNLNISNNININNNNNENINNSNNNNKRLNKPNKRLLDKSDDSYLSYEPSKKKRRLSNENTRINRDNLYFIVLELTPNKNKSYLLKNCSFYDKLFDKIKNFTKLLNNKQIRFHKYLAKVRKLFLITIENGQNTNNSNNK